MVLYGIEGFGFGWDHARLQAALQAVDALIMQLTSAHTYTITSNARVFLQSLPISHFDMG